MRTNPAELEIFKSLFHSVAEEMGAALRRSSYSPNIKERRDYSCAVFDHKGQAAAMGDHMPVHLGSMPMSVQAVMHRVRLGPGDAAVLNDPYNGGTHLPDITLVMPVFSRSSDKPLFYVANRAHHADVGGAHPGSMALSEEIYQEGLRSPPVLLLKGGQPDSSVMSIILANVRTPAEREGDLNAQVASAKLGARRLLEIAARYGELNTARYLRALQDYSARLMAETLRRIPDGTYAAEDFLDDDGYSAGPIPIRVKIQVRGAKAWVDFAGTAPAQRGSVNAVFAVTCSAVFYVFRCLLGEQAPACAGLMRPIHIAAPPGWGVNALPPAAVAAGNVETAQRLVDVLLRALARALPDQIPAASSGTMNNLSFGGIDTRAGNGMAAGTPFAYYETIAGGMGARPGSAGLSGVHTHMTNSLNTPIETLETGYPVRLRRYALRKHSGGKGKHNGGDGVVREIEFLSGVECSILSDRRKFKPYGLAGGEPGEMGKNVLTTEKRVQILPSKCTFFAPGGSVLRIETPGGGGWGSEAGRRAGPASGFTAGRNKTNRTE